MKFRIKRVEGVGFFAQVNKEELFFKNWYTIGRYKLGLHTEDYIDHPVGKEDVKMIIKQYKKSLAPKKIEYFEVE